MIKLEAVTQKDDWLLKLAEWRTHSEIRKILLTNYVTVTDIGWQKQWADRVIRSEAEHFYFITSTKDTALVGYCGLIHLKMIPRRAELSIMIAPGHMNKGYGKEAVRELLKIGFLEFGLHSIYTDCYTNTERWKFFEKCGFSRDNDKPIRATKFWMGSYYDSIIMSILEDEYGD